MTDFFISYNSADRAWAVWLAWQIEAAGYETIVQAWDFRPGCNWVLEMNMASAGSERTIAVLSPDYLGAQYTHPEWATAFAQDPKGSQGKLVPVRVRETPQTGLLSQIAYVDLVGLDESQARSALLVGIQKGRAKPSQPPQFPGIAMPGLPGFPGAALAIGSPLFAAGPPPVASNESLDLFQRVYVFGVECMHKTRYDAERFAADWIASRTADEFKRFADIYEFAVSKMQKSRYDAEQFTMRWLTEHSTQEFARFAEAYNFAVTKMHKARYDAEQFACERLRAGS